MGKGGTRPHWSLRFGEQPTWCGSRPLRRHRGNLSMCCECRDAADDPHAPSEYKWETKLRKVQHQDATTRYSLVKNKIMKYRQRRPSYWLEWRRTDCDRLSACFVTLRQPEISHVIFAQTRNFIHNSHILHYCHCSKHQNDRGISWFFRSLRNFPCYLVFYATKVAQNAKMTREVPGFTLAPSAIADNQQIY